MTAKTETAPKADNLAPAVKKPVEEWAKLKKHTQAAKRDGKLVEVGDWRFAAAKAHDQWPVGLEITEAAYDDAIRRATGVALR